MRDYLTKDLRYMDPELERKYSESNIKHQRIFFYIVMLFGFLVGIVEKALKLEGDQFIYRVVLLILLLICATINWKKPYYSRELISFLTLVYIFDIMETFYNNRHLWGIAMNFLAGANVEFILILTILAKISWKTTTLFSLLTTTINCARYTDFEENNKINFYPLIQFIRNAALISLIAYLFESYNRESFYKLKNYELYISQYKDLIRGLPQSTLIITRDQRILFHNKEFTSLFECQYTEEVWEKLDAVKLEHYFQGENKNLIIISEENQEKNGLFEKSSLTLKDFAIAYSKNHKLTQENFHGVYEKFGAPKALDVRATEIFWESNYSLLIIISENPTMEKMCLMREQTLYRNRLLAIIGHDLKNPLSGMIGIIDMALEDDLEPKIKKYLKIVNRSCKTLTFLINDIVDYVHLLVRGIDLYKERFSLWECILDVLDMLKFHIKMKKISFEKYNLIKTKNYRAFILNDKRRVKQVLLNLLGNALKFTFHGYIKITLKESTPQAYEISIEDTGTGIKPEDQHQIFNLNGKLKYSERIGIGLGLPLSQKIVKTLNNNKEGGEIKVESIQNQGSLFSFLMYHDGRIYDNEVAPANGCEAITQEDSKKNVNCHTMEKLNLILIVDSLRSNVERLTNHLKFFYDFIFDDAATGEEALNLIKTRASINLFYNLILVDCENSSPLGIQIVNITKTLVGRQEIPFVPIVALILNSPAGGYLDRWEELGLNDIIVKPLSNEVIKSKLEKYFIE